MRMVPVVFCALVSACAVWQTEPSKFTVSAVTETQPVRSLDDAADDPAIWIHPEDPSKSLIVGTDKQYGIEVYDLSGNRLQRLDAGRINNIDIRGDLIMGSDRSRNSLAAWNIDRQTRQVTPMTIQIPVIQMTEVYGFCLGYFHDDLYAFVNGKSGAVEQFAIQVRENTVIAQPVRAWKMPSQTEGCVVDDSRGMLFQGVEAEGVWQIAVAADASTAGEQVVFVGEHGLTADVEGLALYAPEGASQYLIVSSQGSHQYFLYDAQSLDYVSHFSVVDDPISGLDGSSETDGLEATATALGTMFPKGVMVVQDGDNTNPKQPQNFKLIDWQSVVSELKKQAR